MNNMYNGFQNIFPKNVKIKQKRKRFLLKQKKDENFLEQKTETFTDEHGDLISEETAAFSLADCGHVIGIQNGQELGARCAVCNATLCSRCSNLRCARCLKVICSSCAKLVDDSMVYCSKCRRIVFLKRFVMGIHKMMSKEMR